MTAAMGGGTGGRRLRWLSAAFAAAALIACAGITATAAWASVPTSLTLASGPVSGDSVALTATVTATTGSAAPVGTVSLWVDGSGDPTITLPVTAGTGVTATMTTSIQLSPGPHTIMASFTGSGDFASVFVSNTVSVTIGGGTTTTPTQLALDVSSQDVPGGVNVTLTATVTAGGTPVTTGSVLFSYSPNAGSGPTPVTVNANGKAVLANLTLQGPQSYTFGAHYTDDSGQYASSDSAAQTLTVAGSPPSSIATSTTVEIRAQLGDSPPRQVNVISPATAASTDAVLVAHVVASDGSTPPDGVTVSFLGAPVGSPDPFNGALIGSAQLHDGVASLPYPWGAGLSGGENTITARYGGDSSVAPAYGVSFGFTTLTFYNEPIPTTLVYTGTTHAVAGQPTTLTAELQDVGGDAVFGEPVTINASLDTDGEPVIESCVGITDADGVAHCAVTFTDSGDYTVSAVFSGDDAYLSSYDVTDPPPTLTVVAPATPTSLDVADVTAASGGNVTLTATLTGADPGALVTLQVLGADGHTAVASCTGSTTATGDVSCTLTSLQLAAGTYTINGTYAGDDAHTSASATGTLTLTGLPSKLVVLPAVAFYHHTAVLSAVLLHGFTPVSGQTVTLTAGTQSCIATTGFLGVASCTIVVGQQPGTVPITGVFAGGGGYAASTGTSKLVIKKQPTTITIVSPKYQLSGTVTVKAKLVDDNGHPIAGLPVVLTLGSSSVTATTAADGTASAQFAHRPAGSVTATATFAGNAYYLGDSASTQHSCYDDSRFLVWGGNTRDFHDAFEVGDHVTFWGSQWSKQVLRGDYGAGSSLKGWADTVTGGQWSMRPGNSSAPPSSVGPFVSVLVTSHASKSGSTISGDVVEHVVVQVDSPSRFDGNPGHAATGVVVAVLP